MANHDEIVHWQIYSETLDESLHKAERVPLRKEPRRMVYYRCLFSL